MGWDKISDKFSKTGETIASLIKVALMSKGVRYSESAKTRPLAILGNGPSLTATLEENPDWLQTSDKMAVNFAANAPQFIGIRPQHYVLADPHFFLGEETDQNVARLWENILAVTWKMTLHIPARFASKANWITASNGLISVKTFNLTPAEGFECVTHRLYRDGMAMPRPRNVLIPSIMIGMREGYKKIYLAGADHSWSRTLWVDEKNRVISVQPHFYKDNEKELDRVAQEYEGYHLHDILQSLTIAFRSYHQIAAYAAKEGVEIINATPGSFIDAFPRLPRN